MWSFQETVRMSEGIGRGVPNSHKEQKDTPINWLYILSVLQIVFMDLTRR